MTGLLVTYSAMDGLIGSAQLLCRAARLNAVAGIQLRMPSVVSPIHVISVSAAESAMA